MWDLIVAVPDHCLPFYFECQEFAPDRIPEDRNLLNTIESYTILLCYKLHLNRLFLYSNIMSVSGVGMAGAPTK